MRYPEACPILQAAYRDLSELGNSFAPCLQSRSFPLLELPDAVLEQIAAKLPACSLAHLQSTCQRTRHLLAHDRYLYIRMTGFHYAQT